MTGPSKAFETALKNPSREFLASRSGMLDDSKLATPNYYKLSRREVYLGRNSKLSVEVMSLVDFSFVGVFRPDDKNSYLNL